MSRFWPLWGIALFFAVVTPIGRLIRLTNYPTNQMDMISSTKYALLTTAIDFVPFAMLFYAVLVSMATWSYLFSSRSVSMMHSIPVNRKTLFITNILSGLTMLLAPFLVFGILYELVGIIHSDGDMYSLLVYLLVTLCHAVFLFSVGTLTAMITGNIVALPILYFIINFLAAGLELIIESFAAGFIYGYSGDYRGVVEWLSPFLYVATHLGLTDYDTLNVYGLFPCIILGFVGIAIFVFSAFLYKSRRSEAAGETICIKKLKPIFVCIFSTVAAILLGEMIYYILGYSSSYYAKFQITTFVVFSAAIGFYGSSMILQKTLAVFTKKSLPGFIATAGTLLVICVLASLDPFKFEQKIPELDKISSVSVQFDNSYIKLDEKEGIEAVRQLNKIFIEDKNLFIETLKTNNEDFKLVKIDYTLLDGRSFQKHYYYCYSNEMYTESSNTPEALTTFMENKYILLKTIEDMNKSGVVDYVSVWGDTVRGFAFQDVNEIQELKDALVLDIKEGNYSFTIDRKDSRIFLEFETIITHTDNYDNLIYYKFDISDSMVHTLEVLNKYGWSQMDAEFQGADFEGAYFEEIAE